MSNTSTDSPELGPTIIEDDDALWALLDLVIIKLPEYVTLRRKIVRRQERLRALALRRLPELTHPCSPKVTHRLDRVNRHVR